MNKKENYLNHVQKSHVLTCCSGKSIKKRFAQARKSAAKPKRTAISDDRNAERYAAETKQPHTKRKIQRGKSSQKLTFCSSTHMGQDAARPGHKAISKDTHKAKRMT
jgi:hypothetical protein